MKNREDLIKEANDLIELITTYKVLKKEQVFRSIKNKDDNVKMSIIKLLQRDDKIYIYNDICSATEKWTEFYDRGMITAFWILLDFWDNAIFNSAASYPF